MPYIITTRIDVHGDELSVDVVSRRAVATLEEALDHAAEIVVAHGDPFDVSALPPMRESGGTVGPLPDGTVIEVARVRWDVIRDEALKHQSIERYPGDSGQPVIDAYNAQHAA